VVIAQIASVEQTMLAKNVLAHRIGDTAENNNRLVNTAGQPVPGARKRFRYQAI
jgi:hypothetical protein